jgi:hypothetical protein
MVDKLPMAGTGRLTCFDGNTRGPVNIVILSARLAGWEIWHRRDMLLPLQSRQRRALRSVTYSSATASCRKAKAKAEVWLSGHWFSSAWSELLLLSPRSCYRLLQVLQKLCR